MIVFLLTRANLLFMLNCNGLLVETFKSTTTADGKLSYTPCYTTFLNLKLWIEI
jgi:hypothetical protein